jgi:hypothetical protein
MPVTDVATCCYFGCKLNPASLQTLLDTPPPTKIQADRRKRLGLAMFRPANSPSAPGTRAASKRRMIKRSLLGHYATRSARHRTVGPGNKKNGGGTGRVKGRLFAPLVVGRCAPFWPSYQPTCSMYLVMFKVGVNKLDFIGRVGRLMHSSTQEIQS